MKEIELQLALAEATQTDKKTASAFPNALGRIAYKSIRKEGEFVLPSSGKLLKEKRPARTALDLRTGRDAPTKMAVKFHLARRAEAPVSVGPDELQMPPPAIQTRDQTGPAQSSTNAAPLCSGAVAKDVLQHHKTLLIGQYL